MQLDKALGRVLTKAYGNFFKALPDDLSQPFDTKEIDTAARVLVRLGAKRKQVMKSIKDRMKTQGREWTKALSDEERAIISAVVRGSLSDPYVTREVKGTGETAQTAGYDY